MLKFLKTARLSVILLAVMFLLFFLHYLNVLLPLENLTIWLLAPIQQRVYATGTKINNLYFAAVKQKELSKANKQLEEEVANLTVANAELKTRLEESRELLLQHDFLSRQDYSAIVAKVIGKNPEPTRQAIILNKGSQDGVKVNLPVLSANGVIAGKIYQVKQNSAQAILLYDSRSRIAALVQNDAKSKGVVAGEHGLSLKMEFLPQTEIVKVGQVVVTSGLEANIPAGLVIGKVRRVEAESNSFFQTAWLVPLIRLDDLTVVSILENPNDN